MNRCVCTHLPDWHAEDGSCQVCGVVKCAKYRLCPHKLVEIVRSLVGGLGIVAAVPFTTAIAALVVRRVPTAEAAPAA